MSMIFSNVGGDLKNYRLQVIDSWVDGESPELMDNPQDGDMISLRSLVDGVPTVTATKVYSNGSWVDAGGGGGGGGYISSVDTRDAAGGYGAERGGQNGKGGAGGQGAIIIEYFNPAVAA